MEECLLPSEYMSHELAILYRVLRPMFSYRMQSSQAASTGLRTVPTSERACNRRVSGCVFFSFFFFWITPSMAHKASLSAVALRRA